MLFIIAFEPLAYGEVSHDHSVGQGYNEITKCNISKFIAAELRDCGL